MAIVKKDIANVAMLAGWIYAVYIIIALLFTALNAYFLYYIDELAKKGCQCALGWHRTFMQVSLVVFILWELTMLVFRVQSRWLSIFMLAFGFIYIVVTRMFIHKIKQHSCMCAETRAFTILDYYNMAVIILLAVYAIVIVVGLLAGSVVAAHLKEQPK